MARDKSGQSYIGFLNPETGKVDLFDMDWQDSPNIIYACERLLAKYPDKKVVVVWDNASWHRSADVKAQLRKHGSLARMHLIALPAYCPDHNPIEHVWRAAKDFIANRLMSFHETLMEFEHYVREGTFMYSI